MTALDRPCAGLPVGGLDRPNDRVLGPESSSDLAAALNNVASAVRLNTAFLESIFWDLPAGKRAAILGVSPRSERRLRYQREIRLALAGKCS
jgi:hypothetical protein